MSPNPNSSTRAKKRRHDSAAALKAIIIDAHSYGELSAVAAMTLIRAFGLQAA